MTRPNIVFIVADDLGFADLGCYGGRLPVSPVLDRMAANGLRFTQGYANSPVCSPTRFALMTGRYQYRLRGAAEEPINSMSRGSTTLGLPPEHPTLPSLLKAAGYRTALAGKWHLGYPPAFGPLRSGYDEFFGPMSGGVDYFTHRDFRGTHDLFEGDAESRQEGYLTDLISRRAVDVVERCAQPGGAPFFLSVNYTAPHWPWETRADGALCEQVKGPADRGHGCAGRSTVSKARQHFGRTGRTGRFGQTGRHRPFGLETDASGKFGGVTASVAVPAGARFADSRPSDVSESGIRGIFRSPLPCGQSPPAAARRRACLPGHPVPNPPLFRLRPEISPDWPFQR